MPRGLLAGLVVALALSGLVTGPTAAGAASGDPVRERGRVTHVADGDTIDVRVEGRSTDTRIRLSGIQSFEIGQCGSTLASDRLQELVEGKQVELRARVASATSDGRPIRSVHLPLVSGGTTDLTEQLLLEGLGLWFPLEPEITDTSDYHVAATRARAQRRGIWQDDRCGAGPQAGHPIDVWVRSDADSVDGNNLNDEYVVVVNRHATQALRIGGWLLRESSQFRQDPSEEGYRFPADATVAPSGRITVRVGSGRDTATEFHMGSTTPLFDNADRSTGPDGTPADLGMGDGAYLLDPRGNVREAFTYPCVVDCSTPLHGALEIEHVEYDPDGADTADNEYVRLRNTSGSRIELDGYQLRNITVSHGFAPGTYLDADEALTVVVGEGTDTRTRQFWGQSGPILANGGDRVDVLSYDERFVDCVDWGTGRDCPWPVAVPGAPGPFADVPADATHASSIEWLVAQGITSGCGDDRFCPSLDVSRAQMATFLTKALGLTPVDDGRFDDVRVGSTHAGSIGAIADAGITSGCGGSAATFCPDADVTRAQMATFLTEAFDLERRPERFDDVAANSVHAGSIGAIAEAGITSGCGGSAARFCPTDPVTRAQMATFLRGALG